MKTYSKTQDLALLALRLIVAAIFISAGMAKFAFWSQAPEGMPASMVALTKFLSIVEPLGGIAVLAGYLTRLASGGLAIIMVGAVFFVGVLMKSAFFTSQQGAGIDYIVLILVACIALVAFGAGKYSVDALRK